MRCCDKDEIPQPPTMPTPKPGYFWKEVPFGPFTISAYVDIDEKVFSGKKVNIPGIAGIRAKADFLYSRGGIVMEGGGYLESGEYIYIKNPLDLDWEDANGKIVSDEQAYWVHNPEDAIFAYGKSRLTPFYSIAAPRPFPSRDGIMLYIPSIIPALNRLGFIHPGITGNSHDGIFEIQDRCYGCEPEEEGNPFGLDLFVGVGFDNSNKWLAQPERHNAKVYELVSGN